MTSAGSLIPERSSPPDVDLRESIRTREAGWPTIALFLIVTFAILTLIPAALRAGPMARVILPEWLTNTLVFGTLFLVGVVGIVFGLGRLRPADVGLVRGKLAQGILVVICVWILIQVVAAGSALVAGRTVALHRSWTTPGPGPTLLWTMVMFLGAGLVEEVAMRGFLFPQFALKLPGSQRARFWTAIVASQSVFALAHIPAHIVIRKLTGTALLSTVLLQGVAGVLLLLLYLRTRNLWIAVGLHGLANAPTPLVRGALSWEIPLLVLLVGWPWIIPNRRHRGLARVERAA